MRSSPGPRSALQAELLSAPAEHLRREDRSVLPHGDFVGIEMRSLPWCRAAQRAHDLAVAVDFENAARDRIGHVHKVIGSDNQTEGMAESPFSEKPSVEVEDLDSRVLPVAHIDEIAVNRDRVGRIKL